jgi:hypothetical protein
MQILPNYDDIDRAPEPSDLIKTLRFIFTAVFIMAVFIVPTITAVEFFIA